MSKRSFLRALLVGGAIVSVSSEILPLRFWPIFTLWTVVAIALAYRVRIALPRPSIAVFLIALSGLVAIVSPPNTWDALWYHLSRVEHWRHQQSLAFFPTPMHYELFFPPWSELAILHLRLLGLSWDPLANLVQWVSLIGVCAAVASLAERFSPDVRAPRLAVAILLATPMVLIQSNSSQNDLVCALWITSLAALVFTSDARGWEIGLAAGLALETKGTAFLFTGPLLLLFVYRRRELRAVVIAVVCVLALNAGPWIRNYREFHTPLGPAAELAALSNHSFRPADLVANATRDLALHFSLPRASWNRRIESVLRRGLQAIGADPDDPRTTIATFALPDFHLHEDTAGNPLTALLALAALIPLARRRETRALAFTLVAMGAALALGLKWQPWQTRLQTPIFTLAAAAIGVAFARYHHRSTALALGAIGLAVLCLANPRPLWRGWRSPIRSVLVADRNEIRFANYPEMRERYEAALHEAIDERHCRIIAIRAGRNFWEYPLWVMARERGTPAVFEHELAHAPGVCATLEIPSWPH